MDNTVKTNKNQVEASKQLENKAYRGGDRK